MPHRAQRRARLALVVALIAAAVGSLAICTLLGARPASAHGLSSTVYIDLASPKAGQVRAEIGLEYDLLVVSAADYEDDDPLFRQGDAAFRNGDSADRAAALDDHAESVVNYVTQRLTVSGDGTACDATRDGPFAMEQREGVPYALLVLDYRCPAKADAHDLRTGLFPDSEGYVTGSKTIVTYDIDLHTGSAVLDAQHPSFSTQQSVAQWFWEFFRLGAEHLLTGLDHILFLLALIAGSRRLREIVLAATTFTIAHSVTFVLAAVGVVDVPAGLVEPLIALSIAVVAGWYLWRIWRYGSHATDLESAGDGHLSLDRAGWTRLAVVFCFGLIHGLGFAGALGINAAWSWTLLRSLLVFNVGIEAVQLSLIALIFPPLALLRARAPRAGLWATGAIAAGVTAMGLIWFVQRVHAA
jgi:hypothetical protein